MVEFRFRRGSAWAGAVLGLLLCLFFDTGSPAVAAVNVPTFHNDIYRTGANLDETVLGTSNVNVCGFGKLFSQPVDGQIYAQPLYMSGVSIPQQGIHNVVYVATMHDSVYAFDADSADGPNAVPIWQRSFISAPTVTTIPYGDLAEWGGDIEYEVGICGTPVIDEFTKTLYVVARTKETTSSDPAYVQRLHALDIASGAEKFGGPVVITASVPGSGYNGAYGVIEDVSKGVVFNPRTAGQRPGLALANGVVYITWASHEDRDPYHGWIIGYRVDPGTQQLVQACAFNVTPNGGRGGIWQGAGAPAVDPAGALYVATGNGSFAPGASNYGNAYLKLVPSGQTLNIATSFTPWNQDILDLYDYDVGSGGPILLPAQAGPHRNLLVGCGKEGKIVLLDRDSMGGYGTIDNIVQGIPNANYGLWGVPAYWNGRVYFGSQFSNVMAYTVANGQMSQTPVSRSVNVFGYPGTTPSVSSNGSANGILWALDVSAYRTDGAAVLHAFDALDLSHELYNSEQAGTRDRLGQAVKFTVPTVANGHVYVGTGTELDVFGLGAPVGVMSAAMTGTNTIRVTFTCPVDQASAENPSNYTLDNGATVISASLSVDGLAVTLTTSTLLAFVQYTVNVANLTDRSDPARPLHAGARAVFSAPGLTGLSADYFKSMDLSGPTAIERVDTQIDFNWTVVPPDPAIGLFGFSVRWTGYVRPPATGDYTFYTLSDDGVRLWVNNTNLVDDWYDQNPSENSGTVTLTAGVKYPITVEYYQDGGGSIIQLSWSGPGISKGVVPSSVLIARDLNLGDVAYALSVAGGLRNASQAPGLADDPTIPVDLTYATLLLRRTAGLEPNP